MIKIFLIVLCVLSVIGLGLMVYAINTAEDVDPKMPFLYGDYDETKDKENIQ